MNKSRDAFRTISEVADWLDTPAHVLRFWESKFTQVKPVKRAGGRRYYRPADMELLGGIKKLLHDDGMTIKGVQKVLREQGVRHVAALSELRAEGAGDDGLIEDAPYIEVDMEPQSATVVSFKRDKPADLFAEAEPEPKVVQAVEAEPGETVAAPEDVAEIAPEPVVQAEPVVETEHEPEPEPEIAVEAKPEQTPDPVALDEPDQAVEPEALAAVEPTGPVPPRILEQREPATPAGAESAPEETALPAFPAEGEPETVYEDPAVLADESSVDVEAEVGLEAPAEESPEVNSDNADPEPVLEVGEEHELQPAEEAFSAVDLPVEEQDVAAAEDPAVEEDMLAEEPSTLDELPVAEPEPALFDAPVEEAEDDLAQPLPADVATRPLTLPNFHEGAFPDVADVMPRRAQPGPLSGLERLDRLGAAEIAELAALHPRLAAIAARL